ncbi:MAG: aminomethyl-transferring glycine dehydrogenase subunit GcvPA [Proteobacteria bacterium]|nr:aminomethyl-transferring glycine dehydrogenase subunit GcvPA [Pseudomonadota bacterium]
MPFIPHTTVDTDQMLKSLNLKELSELFDEIPAEIPRTGLEQLSPGLNEAAISRLMYERQPPLSLGGNFLGAGAYEHYIPAAVWDITSRGEFYTAYTPYQAEASQGTLQLIYEYQTMIGQLMGMEIANASLYDGGSALAEAVLMAMRLKNNGNKRIWVPRTIHPAYRQVLQTLLKPQDVILEELDFDPQLGIIQADLLVKKSAKDLAALIIPQPNFFGALENVDELADLAHEQGALVIALVNPLAMALLKEPGSWGSTGADIVCGEGQPLGVPLASGGPYFGFMCCRKSLVRQLPGRIVGRTQDSEGRTGFVLTLQTREQHIRRAKATSNICTNQGLIVTAATIYMSLLGPQGLRQTAAACHTRALELQELLLTIPGVEKVFARPCFHEFLIKLPAGVQPVLEGLAKFGIQGGLSLQSSYPELGDTLLICVTETKNMQDLIRYQQILTQCLL